MEDLYTEGFVIQYDEGDEISLERNKVVIYPDGKDKLHIIHDGDTLQSIANKYYNKESLWFIIADVNELDNPFFLTTGDSLVIPNINNV